MDRGGTARIEVIRRADLASGKSFDWTDPEKLSVFTPEKRRTLLDNPLSTSDADPVQVVAVKDGRAVGKMDLIAGEVVVGGQASPALWASSLFVPPEHRKTLAGVLLIMKMQQLHPTCAVCGVSAAALPVYEKLRWVDLPLPRYIWLLRSRPVVDRYLGRGPLRWAARVGADAGLTGLRAWVGAGVALRSGGLQAECVVSLPAELDASVRAGIGAGPAFGRSKAWVDWAAAGSFENDARATRRLYLVRSSGGAAVGYFLIKSRFYETATQRNLRNLTLGSVQDWMTFDPAAAPEPALVLMAARATASLGVDAVEVCTRDAGLARLLRMLGFVPAGLLHLLYRSGASGPLAAEGLSKSPEWRLRPGEGDNIFS